jgi:hypothetical protein
LHPGEIGDSFLPASSGFKCNRSPSAATIKLILLAQQTSHFRSDSLHQLQVLPAAGSSEIPCATNITRLLL